MVKTLLNFTKRLCIILGEVTMEDTDWNGIINKLKLSAGPHTPRESKEEKGTVLLMSELLQKVNITQYWKDIDKLFTPAPCHWLS